MFSCRLSFVEYESLMDILNLLDDNPDEFVQNKFRSLILQLTGRLYMDYHGFLKLRLGDGEMTEEELEKLSGVSAEAMYGFLR